MSKEKQIEENKFYVIHTKCGYWVGAYIFSEQLRKAKIYTSIRYANETAKRLNRGGYCAAVLEVDLCLAEECEWIVTDADSGSFGEYEPFIEFKCPKCGSGYGIESGQYDWQYGDPIPWVACPLCGAKMKGGAE